MGGRGVRGGRAEGRRRIRSRWRKKRWRRRKIFGGEGSEGGRRKEEEKPGQVYSHKLYLPG